MTKEQIERINELARKSRMPEGLTPAEKEEQTLLRREYLIAVRQNLKSQLDNTQVQEPDGTRHPLRPVEPDAPKS